MQTLALGTANFAGNYGITKKTKLSKNEIDEILLWATDKIPEIDTSLDYAGSHSAISKHSQKFRVTSKINLNQVTSVNEMRSHVNLIKKELFTDNIERILLRPHSSNSKFTIECIQELEKLSTIGEINELGLSIYTTEELEYFAEYIRFPIVFQVPLNLFNRSFQELLDEQEARFKHFKFYVRSIFLQGLLLLNTSDIPNHLKEVILPLNILRLELSKIGSSTIEATFAFIKERRWVDGLIIGINNLDELKRNYELFSQNKPIDCSFIEKLPHIPSRIRDPRRW